MKTIKILALTILLTALSIAQKEALLIGVGDYEGTQSDLEGIEIDVSNMKNLFEKWGFHTTVLLDSDSMKIDEYLNRYHSLGKDDVFAFYYSGHGSYTDDKDGDESDGQDEIIILSNGSENRFYLDDNLNKHFNSIGAKKLIIFDSCHSGTAFKAFGDKPKPKSIEPKLSGTEIKSKSFRGQTSKELNGDDYIVFSAAQDKEESLATSRGSLFTNAFIKEFSNGGESQNFINLKQKMARDIYNSCQRSGSKVHHPNLSASNNRIKYASINDFLKTKTTTTATTQPQETKKMIIRAKSTFKEGELLRFQIDTNGNSGYLTIFSIEDGEPFIMTKTSNPVNGILNFQDDFNINPPIECYKSCKNCDKEVSSVYIVLSPKPLTKSTLKSKTLATKSFRHKIDDNSKSIMTKVNFTIY